MDSLYIVLLIGAAVAVVPFLPALQPGGRGDPSPFRGGGMALYGAFAAFIASSRGFPPLLPQGDITVIMGAALCGGLFGHLIYTVWRANVVTARFLDPKWVGCAIACVLALAFAYLPQHGEEALDYAAFGISPLVAGGFYRAVLMVMFARLPSYSKSVIADQIDRALDASLGTENDETD